MSVGSRRLVADTPGEIGGHAVAARLAETHADAGAPVRALVGQQCAVRIHVDHGLFAEALHMSGEMMERSGQRLQLIAMAVIPKTRQVGVQLAASARLWGEAPAMQRRR